MTINFKHLSLNEKWNLIQKTKAQGFIEEGCIYFEKYYFTKLMYGEVLIELEEEFLDLLLEDEDIEIYDIAFNVDNFYESFYVVKDFEINILDVNAKFYEDKSIMYSCTFVFKNDNDTSTLQLKFKEGIYYFGDSVYTEQGTDLDTVVTTAIKERNKIVLSL